MKVVQSGCFILVVVVMTSFGTNEMEPCEKKLMHEFGQTYMTEVIHSDDKCEHLKVNRLNDSKTKHSFAIFISTINMTLPTKTYILVQSFFVLVLSEGTADGTRVPRKSNNS